MEDKEIGPVYVKAKFTAFLNDGWLDRAWTQNPISVKSLSKPCPMTVQ